MRLKAISQECYGKGDDFFFLFDKAILNPTMEILNLTMGSVLTIDNSSFIMAYIIVYCTYIAFRGFSHVHNGARYQNRRI